jgi:hypothetical protein
LIASLPLFGGVTEFLPGIAATTVFQSVPWPVLNLNSEGKVQKSN